MILLVLLTVCVAAEADNGTTRGEESAAIPLAAETKFLRDNALVSSV